MPPSNISGSLLKEAAKRANAKTAWDIFEVPFIAQNPNTPLIASTGAAKDVEATKAFADDKTEDSGSNNETTNIYYKAYSGSITPFAGGGLMYIEFEIPSADGKSLATFTGSVITTNIGLGMDYGGVISSGTLSGPKIYWNKHNILKKLNHKNVRGRAFTFSLGNGFTIGADFNVGDYNDPDFSYQVEGVSVGWEGFVGTLKINQDSFSIVKNKDNKGK